jgi:uncharacterized protein YkwD
MRRPLRPLLVSLLVVCGCLGAAPAAHAASAPSLGSASFERPPVAGRPAYLRLRAVDRERAVSGVLVQFAGEGGYGSSACRPKDSGGRLRGRSFRPRRRVTVRIPHVFRGTAPRAMVARLDAQGCSGGGGLLLAPFTVTPGAPGQPAPARPLVAAPPVALPGDENGVLAPPAGGSLLPPGTGQLVEDLPVVGSVPTVPGTSTGGGTVTVPGTGVTVPVAPPTTDPVLPEPLPPLPPLPIARAAASACRDVNLQPTAATAARAARSTLCLVNVLRASKGLRRLKPDRRLARVARRHSAAMNVGKFFAHVDPAGRDVDGRLASDGWLPRPPYWLVGENLAFGEGPVSTPFETVQGWYFSTSHRENMLDPQFDRAGMGVVAGSPVPLAPGATGATYTNVLAVVR